MRRSALRRRVAAGALAATLAAAVVAAATRPGDPGDDRSATPPVSAAAPADVLVGARPVDVAAGFALGAGRFVTVAHVLESGRPVRVRAGRGARAATVVHSDARLDVAVLATEAAPGDGRGAVVMARAVPGGRARLLVRRAGRTVRLPVVVRRRARLRVAGLEGSPPAQRAGLVLSVSVRPGDSGAPLVDAAGRVTGMVFARSRERSDVAYAVDAAEIERLLER
jgi:S1-C subfamily serine protease